MFHPVNACRPIRDLRKYHLCIPGASCFTDFSTISANSIILILEPRFSLNSIVQENHCDYVITLKHQCRHSELQIFHLSGLYAESCGYRFLHGYNKDQAHCHMKWSLTSTTDLAL